MELALLPPLMLHKGCDVLLQWSRELEETPHFNKVAA